MGFFHKELRKSAVQYKFMSVPSRYARHAHTFLSE